ncbi:MAG: OmpH family outer membrane protein [Methylococcales symbiont of Iophon sp. n. MRB-2018]|nr:MAG: OmpH family outer membrane protein [Methylococcales symbiont of Iophon sp. n. MRB-2018]KAF3980098.1 MAG: OmpH family outer membrane protein [Methylococcales symbiont of Iophon sp. n. MRB-2018]
MKKRISLFLTLILLTNVCYAELKIGFVNVAQVLEKAPQAEKAKERLEKEFSPRNKHLLSQKKEIKKLEEKLSRDVSVMGVSERRKLEKDIIAKQRDSKRSQQEFKEDFNVRRNEELSKLQRRIMEAIKALAKDGEFDLLLTDGVIYASQKIDVTEHVQTKLVDLSD